MQTGFVGPCITRPCSPATCPAAAAPADVNVVISATSPILDDLYISGTTFFTLGLGDIQPVGHVARIITVAEAGTQLQQAVQRLYARQLGRGNPNVSSDAGTDQACGEGRARRVYAATVRTRGFHDRPAALDYAVAVIDDLGEGWERQSTKASNDTVTSAGADGHARLSVTASQDGTSYSVAGETDCLPTG